MGEQAGGHVNMSAAHRCVGSNIRRTDRVVTQFYDAILAPSGLYATQFGLLTLLLDAGPITINQLAKVMETDRTTLTRNLAVLVKQGLVRNESGADRRMRLVQLTPEGKAAIERAWPLWQEAQTRIERILGADRVDALLAELAALRATVK